MLLVLAFVLLAQTPQPFPKPGAPKPAAPPATAETTQKVLPPTQPAPASDEAPTEAFLGVPFYPGSEFVGSFDAGKGQRYYLFGSNTGFLEVVNYYKNVLVRMASARK